MVGNVTIENVTMADDLTKADNLTKAKDYIYIVCTVVQTLLAFVTLLFVNYWCVRRKEKKDEQKAETETLAAILSENYDEVENTLLRVKKSVEELRKVEIDSGWNDFHVLLYMYRSYDRLKIQRSELTDPMWELFHDVEKMMKFFFELRMKLPSIIRNKVCPDDIKREFSSRIIEMGETIYPFVVEHRQDVIERVLKYFVNDVTVQEHANPQDESPSTRQCCFPCCGRQSESTESPNANQGPKLTGYPGDTKIKNAFPYLKDFSYQEQGRMRLDFMNKNSHIELLMNKVKMGEMQEKNDEILEKLRALWRGSDHDYPRGQSLLHLIRMTMFKQSEDRDYFNRELLNEFKVNVRQIPETTFLDDTTLRVCSRMVDDLGYFIKGYTQKCEAHPVLGNTMAKLQHARDYLLQEIRRPNEQQEER